MGLAQYARCNPTALKLIADYWVLRIVEELSLSSDGLRFSELQRALGGAGAASVCSPATLSNRLRRLEEQSLIEREDAAGRLSVVYSLSDHGRRVLPVIHAISEFAGVPSEASSSYPSST